MNVSFLLVNFWLNSSYFFLLVNTQLFILWYFCLWNNLGTLATTTTLALTTASYCTTTTTSDISSSSRCCWDHMWLFCCWNYRWLFWHRFHSDVSLLNSDRPLWGHLLGRTTG